MSVALALLPSLSYGAAVGKANTHQHPVYHECNDADDGVCSTQAWHYRRENDHLDVVDFPTDADKSIKAHGPRAVYADRLTVSDLHFHFAFTA